MQKFMGGRLWIRATSMSGISPKRKRDRFGRKCGNTTNHLGKTTSNERRRRRLGIPQRRILSTKIALITMQVVIEGEETAEQRERNEPEKAVISAGPQRRTKQIEFSKKSGERRRSRRERAGRSPCSRRAAANARSIRQSFRDRRRRFRDARIQPQQRRRRA